MVSKYTVQWYGRVAITSQPLLTNQVNVRQNVEHRIHSIHDIHFVEHRFKKILKKILKNLKKTVFRPYIPFIELVYICHANR